MKLLAKFNLILLAVFGAGGFLIAQLAHSYLIGNARDEVQEFPVTLQTGIANGRLSTLIQIDMRSFPFQKVADRSNDTLTLVYGLFDKDGKLLKTVKQTVEMQMAPDPLKLKPLIDINCNLAAGLAGKA